jgi:hypothetical protein
MGSTAGQQALVVIANASEGPWERQLHPAPDDVPVPVDFWNVRPGLLGPVLDCVDLTLFRSDLIDALHDLSIVEFQTFAARIRPPQQPGEITDYCVVKPKNVLHLKLAQIGAHEVAATLGWGLETAYLATIFEHPSAIVVSEALRRSLEGRFGGLRFSEPVWIGG